MTRLAVGIDLGTTHCVMAEGDANGGVKLVDIPQLIAPGEIASRPLLPSFMYLPAPGELDAVALRLPWGNDTEVVGELARALGAKAPGRLVSSAKSWICHGGVNRRAPILPWSAPDSEPHVSPFAAQVAYLQHLHDAWRAQHPGLTLAEHDVVITVPASFDDGARELTVDAAEEAGLGAVRLLEEPQAAFYDFLHQHADELAARLGDARLVLVVDVGGGTTDLTLLQVEPGAGASEPSLTRIAVGGHLMLGGDNMDAALAHHVLRKIEGTAQQLDPTEWSALVQAARSAKERLLGPEPPAEVGVSIQRRGSRLVGGTRTVQLTRDEVETVLLDGFVPFTGADEVTERTGRPGLTTLGLPYVTDPALPRHVCSFLRRHASAAVEAGARVHEGLPQPDLVLLNGGVFNAPALRDRFTQVVGRWYGLDEIALLEHTSLDLAVARGAVRATLARRGHGPVIEGGTARAYYVGVEGPGGRRQAFCVAPRGMSEGMSIDVPSPVLQLVLDREVSFPLYAYTGDRADAAGAVVDVTDELEALPASTTVIRSRGDGDASRSGSEVTAPVTLSATLAESGALELYLVTVALPPRRWRLKLALHHEPRPPQPEASAKERPPQAEQARRSITSVFRHGATPDAAAGLRQSLEDELGPRGQWPAVVCRALADALLDAQGARGASPQHELAWLRLTGWCLRPGWGAPGDEDRLRQLWTVHRDGPVHRSKGVWPEWWILWRRVAAGLGAAEHGALLDDLRPWLAPEQTPPKGAKAHGKIEMLQLLGALERLPPAAKREAGSWFLQSAERATSWLPLGRMGARAPLHARVDDAVDVGVAERWLEELLALDWARSEGAAFAATMIAQLTGDAQRDVSATLRQEVAARLVKIDAPAPWREMLVRVTAMSDGDLKRALGDALPAGLRLSA